MLLGKKGGKNEKIRRLKTTIKPIQHCNFPPVKKNKIIKTSKIED